MLPIAERVQAYKVQRIRDCPSMQSSSIVKVQVPQQFKSMTPSDTLINYYGDQFELNHTI